MIQKSLVEEIRIKYVLDGKCNSLLIPRDSIWNVRDNRNFCVKLLPLPFVNLRHALLPAINEQVLRATTTRTNCKQRHYNNSSHCDTADRESINTRETWIYRTIARNASAFHVCLNSTIQPRDPPPRESALASPFRLFPRDNPREQDARNPRASTSRPIGETCSFQLSEKLDSVTIIPTLQKLFPLVWSNCMKIIISLFVLGIILGTCSIF